MSLIFDVSMLSDCIFHLDSHYHKSRGFMCEMTNNTYLQSIHMNFDATNDPFLEGCQHVQDWIESAAPVHKKKRECQQQYMITMEISIPVRKRKSKAKYVIKEVIQRKHPDGCEIVLFIKLRITCY